MKNKDATKRLKNERMRREVKLKKRIRFEEGFIEGCEEWEMERRKIYRRL